MRDVTTQLMIQVERIVRPLRAREARKLRMRRELLAHLEAAVAEERERGSDEAAAMAAGVKRLGDAAELRRSLQASVPWVERILLSRTPTTGWMDRWGEKNHRELGMEGMALGPSVIAAVGGTVIAYGGIAANALYFQLAHREALKLALGNGTVGIKVGMAVCTVMTLVMGMMSLHVMGRAARGERRGWVDAGLVAATVGLSMGWMAAAVVAIGGGISWDAMLVSLGSSVAMLAGLRALGRWMRGVPRPHLEWLRLEIAE